MDESAVCGGGPVDLPAGPIAEVVREAIARATPEEAVDAVIKIAVETGPCDAASITVDGAGRSVTTLAYSDDRILEADQLQYQFDEGPCVDAASTNVVLTVPDLASDRRWPRWAPAAADLGIGASLSLHLFTDAKLGSLNLYSMAPRRFDAADVEAARVIGAHASVVLAHARTRENLSRAMDTRSQIGLAQGILMERYGLNPASAFAVLRRHSQDQNVKMAVLAEQLINTGHLPGLEPGGDLLADASDRPPAKAAAGSNSRPLRSAARTPV